MSNLKIDIIYYKTSSDFEMEFNLSGCCRMRMFKDKVDTPKGLVNTLARDVARSKIIIVVTDLFGENSGIDTISRAIGLPLIAPDKAEYGIKTVDDIRLPETSVPLVTKAGICGGCIIESGPQSIVIISSARSLRHEIMKTYVHNYVFDTAQLLAYQERMGSKHSAMPSVTMPTTAEPITEPLASDLTADNAEPSVFDDDAPVEQADDTRTDRPSLSVGLNSTAELEFEDIDSNLQLEKPAKKKKGRASNIVLLIIVVLLLLGFGVLAYYFVYMPLITGEIGVFAEGEGNIINEFINDFFS